MLGFVRGVKKADGFKWSSIQGIETGGIDTKIDYSSAGTDGNQAGRVSNAKGYTFVNNESIYIKSYAQKTDYLGSDPCVCDSKIKFINELDLTGYTKIILDVSNYVRSVGNPAENNGSIACSFSTLNKPITCNGKIEFDISSLSKKVGVFVLRVYASANNGATTNMELKLNDILFI